MGARGKNLGLTDRGEATPGLSILKRLEVEAD
jgi:hypothetical protein